MSRDINNIIKEIQKSNQEVSEKSEVNLIGKKLDDICKKLEVILVKLRQLEEKDDKDYY